MHPARRSLGKLGAPQAPENGRLIDLRADYATSRELLTETGVREARPHDARHTAATLLLALGVDPASWWN
ncbi:hypothetical protein ACIA5G_05940 [Amycolatopsis sp. NPDC051758]|uniref:hypothetical protein n=1 Tax=Amycolatopsis sp. NPDC051758 TaxID=3363935 RepID=UPI00379984B1